MTKLYHYTNGTKIRQIIDYGVIFGTPHKPKPRENQVCWLSNHPTWEKTANKIIMKSSGDSKLLNQSETDHFCKGLFRFVIDPDNYPSDIYQWPRLSVEAKIPPIIKKRLISRAKKANVDTNQWFGVIGSVDIRHTTLEVLTDGVWTQISFKDAQPTKNGMDVRSGVLMKYLPTSDNEWEGI